ncbi:MAG: GNAT family N-acetyltransferase [Chloroflexi bacterium]|nr:GNAT family N-acetyltransferase [Chloroflexota bacterium]
MPFTITVEYGPRSKDVDTLEQGLTGHAVAAVGFAPPHPLALFLRDESERVVGGLQATIWEGVLELRLLWVHEDFRGEGYGRQLMEAAEAEGRRLGCEQAVLRSFSYQAPAFFRARGYDEYAVVEGWPKGHRQHHFSKRLTPDRSARSDG